MGDMTWADRLRALYRGNSFLGPASYHELADHLDAQAAEIERLNARMDAAYERLAIDEFGGSYAHDLESLIDYAVKQYLLVCDSEDQASRLLQAWNAATWACVACGYHNRGQVCTHCGRVLVRAQEQTT